MRHTLLLMLIAFFREHTQVSEVFVPKGQKFAFVHFEDKYDAEKGLELNGTTIGGKQVKVTDGKCANKEVDAWRHACRDAYRASVK
mmetsp:Transcript_7153/g.13172  ORF Transcript_7153/g.13172 Transcript_7153/m.13172 type:complete len:86 (+) Transcript_7153:17-274(+)